jgi:hypothetical protein
MRTKKVFSLFLLALFLPVTVFSADERFCFKDTDGSIYDFRGGRLGKKAFTVNVTMFCGSALPGIATFAKLEEGYAVTILVPRPIGNAFCDAFLVSGTLDDNLVNINGNVDYFPRDASPEKLFSATKVMCSPNL